MPTSDFGVLVEVAPIDSVADPQGTAIERALGALGFDGVERVRVGRAIRFTLRAPSLDAAQQQADGMVERLLANPVIEQATVTVTAAASASGSA